jgi:hypothetical protein
MTAIADKKINMASDKISVKEFIEGLPGDRKAPMKKLRETIVSNLPKGFEERVGSGFIHYVVPHSLFPAGYHCNPEQPLPFISLASQKNFIAVYHMGIYGDTKLLDWFVKEYSKHSKTKPDMGKSCIRFKKIEQIPYDLLAELAGKISPQQWIEVYQRNLER